LRDLVEKDMGIFQLCREKFAETASLIGFGTHAGSVAAASDWDGETQVMRIRPSRSGSYERLFHDSGIRRGLLELRRDETLRRRLPEPRLERFIGSSTGRKPNCKAIMPRRRCLSSSTGSYGSTKRMP
jgi:erythromycin esterase-like protein